MSGHPFGIDFGGSGIKGAPVDLGARRLRRRAGAHRHPAAVHPRGRGGRLRRAAGAVPRLLGRAGRGHRARVVRHGVVGSAANIDASWVDTDADAIFTEATGRDVHVVNDADAAGLAEARYGAARGRTGPGHRDHARHGDRVGDDLRRCAGAQLRARPPRGGRPRRREPRRQQRPRARGPVLAGLGRTADRLLPRRRGALLPDLFVVGGGVSKQADHFLPLSTSAPRWCPPPCATAPASSAPPSTRPRPATADAAVRRPRQPRSLALTASGENSWSTTSRVSPTIAASSPSAPSWSAMCRVARGRASR